MVTSRVRSAGGAGYRRDCCFGDLAGILSLGEADIQKPPWRFHRRFLDYFWLRGHATNDTCDWSSRKFPSSPLSLTHSTLSGNRSFKSLKLRGSTWPDNDPPSDSFQWHRRACFLCSDGYARSYQVFDLSGYRRDQVNINIRRLNANNQCVARLALGSSEGFALAPPA